MPLLLLVLLPVMAPHPAARLMRCPASKTDGSVGSVMILSYVETPFGRPQRNYAPNHNL